ncbi:MAG: hypothetical protein ACREJ2_05650 [Planctomycetota bacterium]
MKLRRRNGDTRRIILPRRGDPASDRAAERQGAPVPTARNSGRLSREIARRF